MKITEMLKDKFLYSIEIVPSRNGEAVDEIYNNIEKIKDKISFVSVTKGACGSLRGGTLPISYHIKNKFNVEVLVHYVCRERTVKEIENDLIDLHMFGMDNILALRGDPPAGTNEPWDGDYRFAYRLCAQIKEMNNGIYQPLPRREEKRNGEKTNFAVFVAGHPEDNIADEIMHMKEKVNNGAEAILTQMIFSFEDYDRYVKSIRKAGIKVPVICGIRPVVSLEQIESMEKFFNIKVPEALKKGVKEKGSDFSVDYFGKMIEKLKKSDCRGVHMFIMNDFETARKLL